MKQPNQPNHPNHGRQFILEQWNSFSQQCLPVDCNPVTRREIRRAFYAGAQALMFTVISALSDGPDATDGDISVIEDIRSELRNFAVDVRSGRA